MLRRVGIALGGVFLAGTLAPSAAIHESATVVLRIPAQRVEASRTLTGSPTDGGVRTRS